MEEGQGIICRGFKACASCMTPLSKNCANCTTTKTLTMTTNAQQTLILGEVKNYLLKCTHGSQQLVVEECEKGTRMKAWMDVPWL